MITLKKKDGTIKKMPWKEFGARLWPFGKWCIVWFHIIDGKIDGKKTTTKWNAINSYIMHQSANRIAMNVIGIKKVGGLFDGIEFKPTIERER